MNRSLLMLAVVTICLSRDSSLGSALASSKQDASPANASALRDSVCKFVAAADSILIYEIDLSRGMKRHRAAVDAEVPLDTTQQADWMRWFGVPDTVPLLGSWYSPEAPFGSYGFPAESRGKPLDYLDRASLMELLGDRRAYQEPPPNKCIFSPRIGIRIYRGTEIGEFLMETNCLWWQFHADGASGTGYLRPVLKQYRRFAIRAFRDNPTMLIRLEAMH
jgi:hypothetical protein